MATYPSNLILAGGGQAAPSVAPGTIRGVLGSVTIPQGITLAANDTIPLFYMSSGSTGHIMSWLFDSPALDSGATLTMSLLDSTTPTPTTFLNASTAFRAGAVLSSASAALRATLGLAVNYTAQNLIFLRAIAAAGAALAAPAVVYFEFEITRD